MDMNEWMSNSSPYWATYCALMACRLVALDKRPGASPVGIGDTLFHVITKLVMRAVGDQAKKLCGRLQLCAGLESGIEGSNHAMAQRQREITVLAPGKRYIEESDEYMLWERLTMA